jgi:ArsR family transcriptional regulator, arsenate/arsenite/antimonite-responsive transcriptional repressor
MEAVELAEALRALSAPSRLKIIELLQIHPYCVRALTVRLDISQPAVSQHLAVLKRAGLVEADKEGTMVHYRVNAARFAEVVKALGVVGRLRVPETVKVDM